MKNNLHIESPLTPTAVKIYTEDSVPYLDYTGTCYINGCKCKIHLPKIGLGFTNVIQEEDNTTYDICGGHKQKIVLDFRVFVTDGKFYTYEILERDVSKKQLEKELGYKLNIKE